MERPASGARRLTGSAQEPAAQCICGKRIWGARDRARSGPGDQADGVARSVRTPGKGGDRLCRALGFPGSRRPRSVLIAGANPYEAIPPRQVPFSEKFKGASSTRGSSASASPDAVAIPLEPGQPPWVSTRLQFTESFIKSLPGAVVLSLSSFALNSSRSARIASKADGLVGHHRQFLPYSWKVSSQKISERASTSTGLAKRSCGYTYGAEVVWHIALLPYLGA